MNKFDEIHSLLDRYYDGTASPAETEKLINLLTTTGNLPDELKMERDMLCALYTAENYDIPADMQQRLENALDEAAQTGNRRKPIILWIKSTGIAAAIIAAISITCTIFTNKHITPAVQQPVMAETETQPASEPVTIIPAQAETMPQPEAKPSTPKYAMHKIDIKKTADMPDNVKIVSDQAEAEHYTQLAFAMLTKSIGKAEKSHDKMNNTITEINNKLTKLLQ